MGGEGSGGAGGGPNLHFEGHGYIVCRAQRCFERTTILRVRAQVSLGAQLFLHNFFERTTISASGRTTIFWGQLFRAQLFRRK